MSIHEYHAFGSHILVNMTETCEKTFQKRPTERETPCIWKFFYTGILRKNQSRKKGIGSSAVW
jgi:hypothetical protein